MAVETIPPASVPPSIHKEFIGLQRKRSARFPVVVSGRGRGPTGRLVLGAVREAGNSASHYLGLQLYGILRGLGGSLVQLSAEPLTLTL